ncbi:methionine--tRNA ligase [Patescibacteria group bacterium]|nr:methionine--tRNA ligase [Patescibacteria group bacterium]
MDKKRFYITTTLPYVNAAPHIGFALEIVQADVAARFRRLRGEEVIFNTGTDEHGLKIYRNAKEAGKDVQEYVDENAAKFDRLKQALDLSYTHFIRTTDPHHVAAAQEFWRRCDKNGDIYKKNYEIKYCVGCELEKTESELVGGKCPIHPNLVLELIEEENYFFRFSKYQKPLLELYEKHPDFVVPSHRLTEIRNFVAAGLQDFSISRLSSKMPWGVPVPGDETQVMYVWFDALVNYISTLGWPEDARNFESFWPGVQIAGKDNLRQQSAMWQAMLMSAELPPSRQILIHGFINSGGQKMSKSLGNVIDPFAVTEKYGTDALRFWLLHDLAPFEDGDFTWERFNESYNANLANGLGNFAARVLTLGEKLDDGNFKSGEIDPEIDKLIAETRERVAAHTETYSFNEALAAVWGLIAFGDKYVNEHKPWESFDGRIVWGLVVILDNVAAMLEPFLPGTADKITAAISWEGKKLKIKKPAILFPRIK